MDSSLLGKMEQLIALILQSTKNIYSDEHQKSIFELMLLEKQEITYIEILLNLLTTKQNIITSLSSTDDQLQVYLYIKNFLLRYDNRKEINQIPSIELLITTAFSNFFNDSFPTKVRNIYEAMLDSFFHIAYNFSNPKEYHLSFLNSLVGQLQSDMGKEISCRRIFDYTFIFHKLLKKNHMFIDGQADYIKFLEIYVMILNKIEAMTHSLNKFDKEELYTYFLFNLSRTLLSSFDAFSKGKSIYYYNKTSDHKDNYDNAFFDSDIFSSLIQRCLLINSDDIIGYYDKSNDFSATLSKAKAMFIKLMSMMCNELQKMQMIEQYPNFKLIISTLIKGLIQQMGAMYKTKDYPREKANNEEEEIAQLSNITTILCFFEEVCGSLYGNEIFTDNSHEIFQYIIVPNLLPSPLLLSLFAFEETEFVNQLTDLSHSCKEGLPLQKVLRLLQAMAVNIDGFFKYIILMELDILDYFVVLGTQKKDDPLWCYLIDHIPQEHLIDQVFQIMTSLSFLLHENESVLLVVEDRIDRINHFLIQITNDYLKAKLCMFYSKTLKLFFNDGQQVISQSFDDSLLFIYQCITNTTNSKVNKSLLLAALNSLNCIIFDSKLKKFCSTFAKLYSKQIIYFINSNSKLKEITQSGVFDTFIKGIIECYLIDIDKEAVDIFGYFWKDFTSSLDDSLRLSYIKKPLNERRDLVQLSKNINLLRRFTSIAKSNNKDIKEAIYTPILSLLNNISKYFNQDFEKEILELISNIIDDIQFVPFEYGNILKTYFTKLNDGYDGVFSYKIEDYHITFIFDFLKNMHHEQIKNFKYKEILAEIFSDRLLTIPRKTMVDKIFSDHYVYIDMITVYILFFSNTFTNDETTGLLKLLFKRMNTLPNRDLDLNVKLSMNIFLLANNANDYTVIRCLNMKLFIGIVIQFFPLKDCSMVEHEQIAQFCSLIVHMLLTEIALGNKSSENLDAADYEKLLVYLIRLNYKELKIIKKKSVKKLTNVPLNDSRSISEEEIESKGKIYIIKSRKPHKIKVNMSRSFSFSDDNEENRQENDSEKSINENDDDDNEEEEDEQIKSNENNYRFNDLYNDDKDDVFLHAKKNNNFFAKSFAKYSNEILKVQSFQINVFKLFDMMLTELQNNHPILYNRLIVNFKDKQIQSFTNFRDCQKIAMNGGYIYRKIIKVKHT